MSYSSWLSFPCPRVLRQSRRAAAFILLFMAFGLVREALADDEFGVFGSRLEGFTYDNGLLLTSVDWYFSNIPGTTLIWTVDGNEQPKLQGRLKEAYQSQQMVIVKPYAYFLKDGHIKVYNLAVPAKPYQVYQQNLDIDASVIRVVRDQLWIHGKNELRVLRFSLAEGLVELGRLRMDAEISGIFVDGSVAYLNLIGQGVVRVVGATSDFRPEPVYHPLAPSRVVGIEDQLAYVESEGKLNVVDLSGMHPHVVHQFEMEEGDVVCVQDHKAFLLGEGTLKILDLKNSGHPQVISEIDFSLDLERVAAAFPFGKHVLLGTHHSGLRFYSLAEPADPQPQLSWNNLDYTVDLTVRDRILYVANGHAGVALFDAREDQLKLLSSLDTPGFVVDVALSGKLLLIADEFAGLLVADVADPRKPKILASYELTRGASDLAVHGTRLYVTSGAGSLNIFEIGGDDRLKLIASWDLGVKKVGVTADGRVYASGHGEAVYALTFKDPEALPAISASHFVVLGRAMSLEPFGNELYVAGWKEGFAFFTADGVWHMLPFDGFASLRNAYHIRDVALHDGILYLASGANNLLVVNPRAVIETSDDGLAGDWFLGSVDLQGRTYGLAQEDSMLYVLTDQKLMMLDISRPGQPEKKSEALLPDYAGPGEDQTARWR